ncbi:MAG TPA: hypothetical protein VHN80_04840 [Kineosporiaceae bacterium]|nr:hypothetical protein [Kineosporiaceae bacterium]
MRSAVRRRSPGPWAGGFLCCLAVLAVLGLWLGGGAARLTVDQHLSASVNHRVAVVAPMLRPTPADHDATPVALVILVAALTGVLVCSRRPATVARSHPRRASGRAPPSSLLQA